MSFSAAPTGFHRLTPIQARAVLAAILAFSALCVAITVSPWKSGFANSLGVQSPGDVALYNAEIRRIRDGEGYYQAAAVELRSRGYPTASVFNWRTPLPMWLIGKLPHPVGKGLLTGLALVLIVAALRCTVSQGSLAEGGLCAALLFGAVMPVFLSDLFVMPVLWAGVLIGLSVCAYAADHRRLGMFTGLAALFFRDLAGLYCLLAAFWAVKERRRGEVVAWVVGLTAYGLFFLVHCWAAGSLTAPSDAAHERGWVRFGGLPFVISLVQVNAYLLVAPQWLTALYFVAALAGFASWNTRAGQRIATALGLYLVCFAVVGQPFNQYWGSLIAPLMCFGAARFPAAIKDLWRATARRTIAQPA